jgi:NAD(P)-dependent dehydrogenase (short-subunit alcohol dehydrogenase family)
VSERPWAVVIGVSSGTGAAIALELARDGCDVFGMHRGNHPESARRLSDDLRDAGARCELVVGDAATLDSASAAAQRLHELGGAGSVRVFVHSLADASLGAFAHGPGAPMHPRQFEKTFQTMAHSFVFWAQQLFAHGLLAPGASLLALANPFADSVCGGFGMVAAAKAALEVYVRYLAFELGPLGHRVNVLKFGLVETPAVKRAFTEAAWAQVMDRVAKVSPAGRVCTVEEVARFVRHVAHDDAAWLNGATVDFTGGQAQSLLDYLFRHR